MTLFVPKEHLWMPVVRQSWHRCFRGRNGGGQHFSGYGLEPTILSKKVENHDSRVTDPGHLWVSVTGGLFLPNCCNSYWGLHLTLSNLPIISDLNVVTEYRSHVILITQGQKTSTLALRKPLNSLGKDNTKMSWQELRKLGGSNLSNTVRRETPVF